MHILITGAAGCLAQQLAATLGQQHHLRLMDRVPVPSPPNTEFLLGDLLDPAAAWQAVRGMEVVIHTAAPPPDLPAAGPARDQALLELGTRGTHVLLSAAVEAGVRQCLYAGTLELFAPYPDELAITENFRPLPPVDMEPLSNYLGELGCREFAFACRLAGTCLRLGTLVREEQTAGLPPDPGWLDVRDAAQAFACALQHDGHHQVRAVNRWSVYHVAAAVPNPRFLIGAARGIGYAPVHNFAAGRASAAPAA
jgi:nucleoside-diphosphate-sugar epimerase